MLILTVILIGVVLFGMAAGYLYNRSLQRKMERGELSEPPAPVEVDQECCGQHEVCEKESLLAAVSKQSEDEVAGWSRSLQLRGIQLPDELKDELFMIVGERRFRSAASPSR